MSEKYYVVESPHGERWGIPLRIIAEARAKYYSLHDVGIDEFYFDKEYNTVWKSEEEINNELKEKNMVDQWKQLYQEEFDYTMSREGWNDAIDYAQGNMNWKDVVEHAITFEPKKSKTEEDYQEMWVNPESVECIER